MNFALQSSRPMGAACAQYYISRNRNAPVSLMLSSDQSYCFLDPIKNQKIKDILMNVGAEYEKINHMAFSNFIHTFKRDNMQEIQIENDHLVNEIFSFISAAIDVQTNEKLTLKLEDVLQLQVQKAIDSTFSEPLQAYELFVKVPEQIITTVEQSGISCKKFGSNTPPPEGSIAMMKKIGESSSQNGE